MAISCTFRASAYQAPLTEIRTFVNLYPRDLTRGEFYHPHVITCVESPGNSTQSPLKTVCLPWQIIVYSSKVP